MVLRDSGGGLTRHVKSVLLTSNFCLADCRNSSVETEAMTHQTLIFSFGQSINSAAPVKFQNIECGRSENNIIVQCQRVVLLLLLSKVLTDHHLCWVPFISSSTSALVLCFKQKWTASTSEELQSIVNLAISILTMKEGH